MADKYERLDKEYADALGEKQRESRRLGNAKLLLVAVILFLGWTAYRSGFHPAALLALGAALAAEAVLWVRHSRVCDRVDYLSGLVDVVRRYRARTDGTWTAFPDCGAELADPAHPYTQDLDIFGEKSLFQYLNCTGTHMGRRQLAEDLGGATYTAEEITRRQQAVAELAKKEQFSLDFQCWSGKIRERESVDDLGAALKGGGNFIRNEWLRHPLRIMPLVFTPVALLIFALGVSRLYFTAVLLLGILALVWIGFSFKTTRYTADAGRVKYGLGQYAKLYDLLQEETFESDLLRDIQSRLSADSHSAARAIGQLDDILSRLAVRNNAILYLVCNVLLLWDIRCAFSLQSWKDAFLPYVDGWFAALGELESLLSLSVPEQVSADIHYPTPLEEPGRLRVREMGHPLIPAEGRVCNSFTLDGGIAIISGSNMSGKTTFLRTIGINLVLAKCGAGVCAGEMAFSDFTLVTSMRIVDDLHEGVSTFYAELKRIKAILDTAEAHGNVMFFIDEIFRGTNSADRLSGARAVVHTLADRAACGFLTTHDLALCRCADDDDRVSNWHFSERYTDGGLVFDYTIRPGVARSTNGAYLMEMIGIKPQPEGNRDGHKQMY